MSLPTIANNEETLSDYIDYLKLQDHADQTIKSKTWGLVPFFKYVDYKASEDVTQKDIQSYAIHLKRGKKKQTTQNVDLQKLRNFFDWLVPGNDLFKNIKTRKPKLDTTKKEYINQNDVTVLLSHCRIQRDRALIFLLWESAARIGEVLSLNVENVKPDTHGIIISVTGKTGKRDILLIDSVPDIQLWLNTYNGVKDAPLFPTPKGTRLTIKGAQLFLSRLGQKAGIEGKSVHPHSFRHGRLTELSNFGLSEMQLRLYAGWTKNSDMPATYIHTAQKDVYNKLLKIKGIEQIEQESAPENKTSVKKCPRCLTENPFDSKYCRNCSLIIDAKTAANEKTLLLKDYHDVVARAKKIFGDVGNGEDILNQFRK
jgi:integrase/recombinase XerD